MNLYEDGGCLYLADNVDGNPGGNTVSYNRVEYYGSQDYVRSIYFDNYAENNTADHNVIYNGVGGAAPSAVVYINTNAYSHDITVTNNTAYTAEGTFIKTGEDNPCEDCTYSNNVWADDEDYPYLGGAVYGPTPLLNFMKR
jgi:hypothetical protein